MKILKHRGLPQKSRLSWGHNITIGAKGREKKTQLSPGEKKKKKESKKQEDQITQIHCYPGIVRKIQTQVARTQMLCETHTTLEFK